MATPTSVGQVGWHSRTNDDYIDGLLGYLGGYKWGSAALGSGATVSYSFIGYSYSDGAFRRIEGSPTFSSGYLDLKNGWYRLQYNELSAFVDALDAWSEVANVSFVPCSDNAAEVGDIRAARTTSFISGAAVTGTLGQMLPKDGDIWLGSGMSTDPRPASHAYATYLHELGHALGLRHPHEHHMPADGDELADTVMSYRAYAGASTTAGYPLGTVYPTTPMLLDILAIQTLYGANHSTRAGDTTYTWKPGATIFETLWDGGGNDTVDWSNQGSAAIIDLNEATWNYLGPARPDGPGKTTNANLMIAYGADIENANGGSAADSITGNALANVLHGNGGYDWLYGGGGNDIAHGDDGNDVIYGEDGADALHGGQGSDIIYGGAGNDVIRGEDWGDWLDGDDGNDTLYGGDFALDILIGDAGNDTLWAGNGGSVALGGGGADRVRGGAGNDWVEGGLGDTGSDMVWGGAGNDVVVGGGGYDQLFGEDGDDLLIQSAGRARLEGGTGNDWLYGGMDNDAFGTGDTLIGGQGTDNLVGFGGNDIFWFRATDFQDGLTDTLHGFGDYGTDNDVISIQGVAAGAVFMTQYATGVGISVSLGAGQFAGIFVWGMTVAGIADDLVFS